MTILKLHDIKHMYGDKTVFSNLGFELNEGMRLGVVGKNGAGKSTLAKIIAGEIKADSGFLKWYKKVEIGYMKQISEQTSMEQKSNGEITKQHLLKVFSRQHDLLILDEPTNHLDYLGVEWLVRMINEYKGTIIIISHDRAFLDAVASNILEIEDGKSKLFEGNYSVYSALKKESFEVQQKQYIDQKQKENEIREKIEQLKVWSRRGHDTSRERANKAGPKKGVKEKLRVRAKKKDKAVKSQIKRLNKLITDGVEKPKEQRKLNFSVSDHGKNRGIIINCENVSISRSQKKIFSDATFSITKGEKTAIVGQNGCGKTTLIKAILGEINIDSGNLYRNYNVTYGYMSQDILELPEELRVSEYLKQDSREKDAKVCNIIAGLGLEFDIRNQLIGSLSLGERTRIKLAQMLMSNYELIIMDEPTNHIDTVIREAFERALIDYEGTILIVAHDLEFIDRICSNTLLFTDGINNKYPRTIIKIDEKPSCAIEYARNKKREVSNTGQNSKYDQLLLENKISEVVSKLSFADKNSGEYITLEEEYERLIERLKILKNTKM